MIYMNHISRYVSMVVFFVCAAAVVFGVALRLVETVNRNYVFGFDQGLDMMAARSIAFEHTFTLIGSEAGAGFAGLPGIFHGPGYHYILAVILFFSFGNPYGSIVFLCVLSFGVLYALYKLANGVFGKHTAQVTLLLSAVSLPLSAQARMIWAPNFSGLIALPFLYALWRSETKRYLWIFLTAFLAACLYHFEIPMAVPALLATCVYFMGVLRIRDIRRWAIALCGVMLGFMPMILFEARHGWNVVRGILSYGSSVTVSAHSKPFSPIAELIGDGNALLSTMRESYEFGVPWFTYMFPFLLIGAVCWYAYREKKSESRQFITGLLILIGAHLFVYYPYRGPVYAHYFSLLYVVYPLVGAYVATRALQEKITRWIAFGLGALLLLQVFSRFPKTISYDYSDYGGTAKIQGKIDAIDSIYAHAKGERFNLFVFTPPVIPYAYDYLLGWYAQKTYGYVPGSNMNGLVYLLIEPDPEKPWSYNGWLETVIKKGTVADRWKLPSGFIVEKRYMEETK